MLWVCSDCAFRFKLEAVRRAESTDRWIALHQVVKVVGVSCTFVVREVAGLLLMFARGFGELLLQLNLVLNQWIELSIPLLRAVAIVSLLMVWVMGSLFYALGGGEGMADAFK